MDRYFAFYKFIQWFQHHFLKTFFSTKCRCTFVKSQLTGRLRAAVLVWTPPLRAAPARRRADVPTYRRANAPPPPRADVPPPLHADVPTCHRPCAPTCHRPRAPSCRRADVPTHHRLLRAALTGRQASAHLPTLPCASKAALGHSRLFVFLCSFISLSISETLPLGFCLGLL